MSLCQAGCGAHSSSRRWVRVFGEKMRKNYQKWRIFAHFSCQPVKNLLFKHLSLSFPGLSLCINPIFTQIRASIEPPSRASVVVPICDKSVKIGKFKTTLLTGRQEKMVIISPFNFFDDGPNRRTYNFDGP